MNERRSSLQAASKGLALDQANRRMNQFMFRFASIMVAYGLLLPTNWQEMFGIFGFLINWAGQTAPATVKVASVSPIPELVSGFFGFGAWGVVCFAVLLAWKDPLAERIRYAFTRPGKSPWKTGVALYFLGVPVLLLCLWVVFFMPIDVNPNGVTWGSKVLFTMISGRLALALLGSLALVGVGLFFFLFLALVIGPVCLVIKGGK